MLTVKPHLFAFLLCAFVVASCVPSYQKATAIPSPTVTEPYPTSSTSVSPPTTPTPESAALAELKEYALSLINKDRADHGIGPVRLGNNSAAQAHADDMVENFYISHWDSGGMKPYMRYTQAGGQGAVSENAAYSGPTDSNDKRNYVRLDPKETIKRLEYSMMYEDEASDRGHRDNILDSEHQYVSIGIAFTSTRLGFIQHFEEIFLAFTSPPALANGALSLSAKIDSRIGKISSIDVFFDYTPVPLTNSELMSKPHYYHVGEQTEPILHLVPAPPPSFRYSNLGPEDLIAKSWNISGGSFSMSANVGNRLLAPGVYTLLIWAEGIKPNLTTYSIFVD